MTVLWTLSIALFLVVGATASEADEFFGKPEAREALPVSGPVPGKELPSRFAAKHVTGKYLNPISTLE